MIKAAIEDCQELRVTTTFNPSNCGIFWIPEFLKKTSKICPKEALEGPTSGGPKVSYYYVIQCLKCSQSQENSVEISWFYVKSIFEIREVQNLPF